MCAVPVLTQHTRCASRRRTWSSSCPTGPRSCPSWCSSCRKHRMRRSGSWRLCCCASGLAGTGSSYQQRCVGPARLQVSGSSTGGRHGQCVNPRWAGQDCSAFASSAGCSWSCIACRQAALLSKAPLRFAHAHLARNRSWHSLNAAACCRPVHVLTTANPGPVAGPRQHAAGAAAAHRT